MEWALGPLSALMEVVVALMGTHGGLFLLLKLTLVGRLEGGGFEWGIFRNFLKGGPFQ